MNDDELWAAIDAQRLRTVTLLKDLTPVEWDRPSLCDGWRVRDVAAHLTMQQMTLRDGLKAMIRHPGGMNHLINAAAVTEANRRPPEQHIADIGRMVGSRRHNFGLTARETLIDIVVHGQDIAVPLGRRLEVPPASAATAATQVWSYQASRMGRRIARVNRKLPFQSYRLIATDTDWVVGSGQEIRGPVLAILLLITGRTAGYADLAGPGAVALATTLGLTRTPRRGPAT
jgi:uncharacterized protein (TIGR03083 family)